LALGSISILACTANSAARAHAVSEHRGELGVIENAYLMSMQKPRHALGVTNRRKPPVVTVRS